MVLSGLRVEAIAFLLANARPRGVLADRIRSLGPVLKVEILSPSNRAEAWRNVWLSTAIPSIRERLILSGTASLLRRSTGQHDSRGSETFEVRGPLLPHSRWQRGNRDDGCLDLGDRLPVAAVA